MSENQNKKINMREPIATKDKFETFRQMIEKKVKSYGKAIRAPES